MIEISQRDLPYLVLTVDPYLQAYRTDRLAGVERSCPKPDGDLICDQVSYAPWLGFTPPTAAAAATTEDEGGTSGLLYVLIASSSSCSRSARSSSSGAGAATGRRSRSELSPRWLAGKVLAAFLTLIFVLVFNFFLFRVMGDPTSQLARLPRADARGDPAAAGLLRARQAAARPVRRLRRATPRGSTSASARRRAARCGRRSRRRCRGRCCWSASGRCWRRSSAPGWGSWPPREEAPAPTTRCSASACSRTRRPSTGSG